MFCFLTFQKRSTFSFGLPEHFHTHQNFFLWLFFPLCFLFAGVKSPKSARYLNTCWKLRACLSALLTWSQRYFLKSFKRFRTWIQNVLQKFQNSSISCANNSYKSIVPSDSWSSRHGELLYYLYFKIHFPKIIFCCKPKGSPERWARLFVFLSMNIASLLAVVLQ